jgi:hypothetical protein
MTASAELREMAKSAGRPKSDRDDITIRVSRPLASKLKALANDKGVTVGEIADELFTAPLARAYAQLLRKLDEKS